MQTSTIQVALRGDAGNTVIKTGATVPETLVLMAGHGQHSVILIPDTLEETRGVNHLEEIARLTRAYDAESVKACFGEAKFGARLPTRFSEIGLAPADEQAPDDDDDDKETPAAKKKRLAAEKAHAALLAEAKKPVGGDDVPPAPAGPPADILKAFGGNTEDAHKAQDLALVD